MTLELAIIRLYDSNLRGFYTINQIATKLGKAYPYVHRKVTHLLGIGVLRSTRVGTSHCICLNLKSRRAVLYLTELELEKRSKLPEQLTSLAKQLETDGTLAIETAVYGNGTAYIISDTSFPGTTNITPARFKELLLTTTLFSDHVVLHGYERFFAHLASMLPALDQQYNPLLQVNP